MPSSLPGRRSKCRNCQAPIVWARTVVTGRGKGGKLMPLDPVPNDAGNVAVRETSKGVLVARVLGKDEGHDRVAEILAMPHWATCAANPRVAGKQLVADVEEFLRERTEGSTS